MSFREIEEAPLAPQEGGLAPEGGGWFIANVAEARALHYDRFGHACSFEGASRFPEFGINVHVLEPGQASGIYHREDVQEAFLVLSGECLAIVEEQERPLRTGDLLYCPPGTAHILIGAGEAPSTVLMVGARKPDMHFLYPRSEAAGRHLAASEHETDEGAVAYAGVGEPTRRALGSVPW
jgi:uncharacterized cupin superfamily protein